MQKGFSIEGYVPENGILTAEKDINGMLHKRVLDKVDLDGVLVVPRPALKSSRVNSVCKALGEINPWKEDIIRKSIQSTLQSKIEEKEMSNQYYKQKWDINDALEMQIEEIMSKPDYDKQDQLNILFDEYKNMMIPIIIQSESLFVDEDESDDDIETPYKIETQDVSKSMIYKKLYKELQKFSEILKKRRLSNG